MADCDPRDIAIKSFFLGPQAENSDWLRGKWNEILEQWLNYRKEQFPQDGPAITLADRRTPEFVEALGRLDREATRIARELQEETPKFTPRYIGHMVSEVSLPALIGHICALLHNPNNTSREVSRVTSRLEDEAIGDLARMLGFTSEAEGHFTSGGTLANFEALWRSLLRLEERGERFQRPVVFVPRSRHFSWEKGVSLMGLGPEALWHVELDDEGRPDADDLRRKLGQAAEAKRPVAMVVSVAGTTEMGEIDPIDVIQDLVDEHRAQGHATWHHVDAAYGGYFASLLDRGELEAQLSKRVAAAFRAIARADSVTLDPHKLGYVPYACGAFIARDAEAYRTRKFSADYLLDKNDSRWAHTLEGSRSGAGVTATWLSNKTLGLDHKGYGRLLAKGLEAREAVLKTLRSAVPEALPVLPADLNVLCFSICAAGDSLSRVNRRTMAAFHAFEHSPNFSLSKTILRKSSYGALIARMARERQVVLDDEQWVQLRLVLMNPFLVSTESKTDFIAEFAQELARVCAASSAVTP